MKSSFLLSFSLLILLCCGIGYAFAECSISSNIFAFDANAEDNFGHSVTIDGSIVAIGASKRSNNQGAVYVYEFDSVDWNYKATLLPPELNSTDYFGHCVATNNGRIVVGTDSIDSNQIYVYEYDGASWDVEPVILSADEPAELFGTSVDISDNTIVVGAYGDESEKGSAYVFEYDGANWSQVAKLTASDGLSAIGRSCGDRFGISVAIDANRIVVGAPHDDTNDLSSQHKNGSAW